MSFLLSDLRVLFFFELGFVALADSLPCFCLKSSFDVVLLAWICFWDPWIGSRGSVFELKCCWRRSFCCWKEGFGVVWLVVGWEIVFWGLFLGFVVWFDGLEIDLDDENRWWRWFLMIGRDDFAADVCFEFVDRRYSCLKTEFLHGHRSLRSLVSFAVRLKPPSSVAGDPICRKRINL